MNTMLDSNLLHRYAARRDTEAFSLLVHQYQGLVLATCRRRLQSTADVEDAVQETFLRLAQNAGRINSNVGGWLHRCAMNTATDFNRRRATRARHESAAAIPADAAFDTQRELAELRQHVDAALAELPEAQRELIIQRYFVGRAAGELAQGLGIAPSTLTYRLQQAVEALRGHLVHLSCAGGAGMLAAAMEAEHASAVVPGPLTANVMKIGLKGVPAAGAAGGIALAMKVGVAAAVVAAVSAGVWVMGARGTDGGQPAAKPQPAPVATTAPAREGGPVAFRAAPASNDPTAAPAAPDWQKTQAAAQPAVLAGRVLDSGGKAVPGAKVSLGRFSNLQATTDANGWYTFATVPNDGEYQIEVTAKGFVSAEGYGRNAQPAVQLSRTAEARRDITLQRGATLVVTVTDEQGQGISGVGVDAFPVDNERGSLNRVTTDASGMVTITVPVGKSQYVVAATDDRFAPARALTTPDSADTPVDVNIALAKGRQLQGMVICSDGKPAAGWAVYVQPDWWKSPYIPKSYPIGKDGRFTIPHVGDGEHQVWLSRGNTGHPIGNVRMPVAQMPIRLDVPFVSAASRTEIKGKVTIAGKRPDYIHVFATGDDEHFSAQVDLGTNPNSTEGTFTIKEVPPGVYRLSFESPETEPKVLEGVKVPGEVPPVQLVAAGRPTFRGIVTDAATGKPITHFAVRVIKTQHIGNGPSYVQEPKWAQVANSDGRFSVELVGPGVYQAQVSADGYAWLWSDRLRVESASAKNELEMRLTSGGALAGLIVGPQGKPMAGAKVIPFSTARSGSQGYRERFQGEAGAAVTDTDGRFTLAHLAPGEEKLRIVHPQLAPCVVDGFKVTDGKVTDVGSIALAAGGTAEGTVYDSEGRPAAGVALHFQDGSAYGASGDEEAGRVATVTTDEEGRYRVEHLGSEKLYVNVVERWTRKGVVRRLVRPVDGKVTKLDFGGATPVRGRLVGKSGPVPNQIVQLSWGSPHFGPVVAVASTDGDGRFAFFGAPAGKYTLYQRPEGGGTDFKILGEVAVAGQALDLGEIRAGGGEVIVGIDAEDPADAERVAYVGVTTDITGVVWQEQVAQARRNGTQWRAEAVPAGKCRIIAQIADGNTSMVQMPFERKADGSPTTLTLRVPKRTATLEATVVAGGADENPMKRVAIISNTDQTISAYVQGEAKASKALRLPPGTYQVMDMASGMARADIPPIVLQAGETRQVTINAEPAQGPQKAVAGVLVWSADGTPVQQELSVRLVGSDGSVVTMLRRVEGMAMFSAPPGTYQVEVDVPGREKVTQRFELPAMRPVPGHMWEDVNVVLP